MMNFEEVLRNLHRISEETLAEVKAISARLDLLSEIDQDPLDNDLDGQIGGGERDQGSSLG